MRDRDRPASPSPRNQRGKPLAGVRPTTAKVLESLMATLAPDVDGARALDLFAGTGAVGLGLLALGAAEVTFVEADAKVAGALRRRISQDAPPGKGLLLVGRIPQILSRLEGRFALLLADPPYDWEGVETLLPALARVAEQDAILVVEHHHKTLYDDSEGWELYRQKKYGETRLSFFRFAEKR